jgi:diketogulonate reductase-like aldo/keto reductase
MSVPTIKLADGNSIPQLGLGTWQVTDPAVYDTSFEAAVTAGYRHFDTAQAYHNEQFLGRSWTSSGLKRSDIFLTTKINVTHFIPNSLRKSFEQSLKKLQTDYVNLVLLHFPVPLLRKKAWAGLEELKTGGLVNSIGVSNFTIRHLEEMKKYANQMPVINQVEMHVFLQQPELADYCKSNYIQLEAYSPLARAHIMDNPVITEIAGKYNKSYAQVMLRFLIERGLIVIPKSASAKRVFENIDIFNFNLNNDDMRRLNSLDMNKHYCWSPVHIP